MKEKKKKKKDKFLDAAQKRESCTDSKQTQVGAIS